MNTSNDAPGRAGALVRHLNQRDLRHTCATVLLMDGVNEHEVMELLGHSSITLTMGTSSELCSAARIRTWTFGTKIRGAAVTPRRTERGSRPREGHGRTTSARYSRRSAETDRSPAGTYDLVTYGTVGRTAEAGGP